MRGSGIVKAKVHPRDELFGLTFRRAIRVYRRVEVLQEFKEMEYPEHDDEMLNEPKEVIKQRWIEVRKEGMPIRVNYDEDGHAWDN